MKKLIAIICILQSVTLSAQISVAEQTKTVHIGKVLAGMQTLAELSADIGTDTTYLLTFFNHRYPSLNDYKTVAFKGNQATLDQLKSLMLSVFSDENKKNKDYKQILKLGTEPIIIANFRSMGMSTCQFIAMDAHVMLSENQVKKLFGR